MDYDDRVAEIVRLCRGRVLHLGAVGNVRPEDAGLTHFLQAALKDAGLSVIATDINDDGLDWLRSHNYEAEWLDAENIPADGEQFDTIVAGELIEHLSRPGDMLDGCHRRLAEGGLLVLSTPQPFAPMHILMHRFRPGTFNLEHTCWYDEQTLSQLLSRHGFEVVRVGYVDDLRAEKAGLKFRMILKILNVVRRVTLGDGGRTTLVVAARKGRAAKADAYADRWAGNAH